MATTRAEGWAWSCSSSSCWLLWVRSSVNRWARSCARRAEPFAPVDSTRNVQLTMRPNKNWDLKRLRPLIETRLATVIASLVLALAVAGVAQCSFRAARPSPSAMADLVVVHKAARRLELYRRGVLLRSFAVSLGPHPTGPKQREGDGRTPEGDVSSIHRRYPVCAARKRIRYGKSLPIYPR